MKRGEKITTLAKKLWIAGAVLTAVGMMAAFCISVWAAESDASGGRIASFVLDTLETVYAQAGTPANELALPSKITARVYLAAAEGAADGSEASATDLNAAASEAGVELREIPVTWESADYQPVAGAYWFTAVLPEGYTTTAELPAIQVEVADQQALASTAPEAITCTCGAAEGEAHGSTCPLYTAPEASACTCGAAEGEAHGSTCPLYFGTAALYDMPTLFGLDTPLASVTAPVPETIVNKVEGKTNTFDITLRLYAKAQQVSDVVLVMDISGTMVGEPMRQAKVGALQFINTLLSSPSSASRIALVTFDSGARQVTDFCSYAQKSTLISAINGLSVPSSSATFTQGGLRVARNLTASASGLNGKNLVVLSDGLPNLGYMLSESFFTNAPDSSWFEKQDGTWYNSKNTPEAGFITTTTYGTGAYGFYVTPVIKSYLYCHAPNSAISEANLAKAAGNTIYTIGYNLENQEQSDTLTAIASPGKFVKGTSENISTVLNELANTLQVDVFKNGLIESAITPGFVLDTSFTPTNKSSSHTIVDSKNITWSIPSISVPTSGVAGLTYSDANTYYAELVYRIVATDEIMTIPVIPDANGKYTTLKANPDVSYTDNTGAGQTVTLDNPPVPLEITPAPPINPTPAGASTITGTSAPGAVVKVTLPNGTTIPTTAGADGNWSVNVPAGVTLAAGDTITATAKDGDKLTSLPGSGTVTSENVPGEISGNVWIDANGDGKRDTGESPMGGLTLGVFANDDANCTTPVNDINGAPLTVQTDASGAYRFSNVPPGTYKVVAITPAGYHATTLAEDNAAADNLDKGWIVIPNLTFAESTTAVTLTKNMGLDAKLVFTKSVDIGQTGTFGTGTAEAPLPIGSPEQIIQYQINVHWDGTSGTVTGVTVRDVLPEGLVLDDADPASSIIETAPAAIRWDNVTIHPGDNLFHIYMIMDGELPEGQRERLYQNAAQVTRNGVSESTNSVYIQRTKANNYPLAITKTLTAPAAEDETFVFCIQRQGDANAFYAVITVPKGATTATVYIKELYADTYTVTELGNNWRYAPEGGAVKTVTITTDNPLAAAVTFTNKRTIENWLSGKAEVTNKMVTSVPK